MEKNNPKVYTTITVSPVKVSCMIHSADINPAAVYSAVRTEEVGHGQLAIRPEVQLLTQAVYSL